MSIKFPPIQARQVPGNTTQSDRARWKSDLQRQAREVERRDRAAFQRYKGAI
jgi:hypothetical protein